MKKLSVKGLDNFMETNNPIPAERLFDSLRGLIEDSLNINRNYGVTGLPVEDRRMLAQQSRYLLEKILQVVDGEWNDIQGISSRTREKLQSDQRRAVEVNAGLIETEKTLQEAEKARTDLQKAEQTLKDKQEKLLAEQSACEALKQRIEELDGSPVLTSPSELMAQYRLLFTPVNSAIIKAEDKPGLNDQLIQSLQEKGINSIQDLHEATELIQRRIEDLLQLYKEILKECINAEHS